MNARAWLVVLLAVVAPRVAHAQRFAVVIASNTGREGERALEFAERDGSRMADLLTSIGGVRPDQLVVVQGASAQSARQALITTNERIRNEPAQDSLLIVYYSGHSDGEALHLGETSLPFSELEGLVRGSAARLRVLIVDSCRSGTLTRSKGGRPAPRIELRLTQPTGEGVVVLTAASAGEDAQESPDVQGSFFTHHLLSGLLGAADANRDGRVTIAEAYEYAYANTLRDSSATLAGVQRPGYRYDIRGQGEVVLTELTAGARGRLVLPAGLDVLVLRGSATGPVIAEARTPLDRTGVLSVSPGQLFIRVRTPRALFEQQVTLRSGQTLPISLDAMDRIELTRLARKGGTHVPFVAGAGLSLITHRGIADGHSYCSGGAVHASLVYRWLSVAPRLAACRERFRSDLLTSRLDEVQVSVGVNLHRDLAGRWSVYAGPEVGVSYFRQQVTPTDHGLQTSRRLGGGELALQGGVDVNLGAGVVIGTRVLAEMRFLQLDNPTLAPVALSAVFVWGAELGVTLYFR